MMIFKIRNYEEIKNVEKHLNKEIILDFKESDFIVKRKVIEYLIGLTNLNYSLKKINKYQIIVQGVNYDN